MTSKEEFASAPPEWQDGYRTALADANAVVEWHRANGEPDLRSVRDAIRGLPYELEDRE